MGAKTHNQNPLSAFFFFSYFPPPAEPVKALRCNMVRWGGGGLMLSADEMGEMEMGW